MRKLKPKVIRVKNLWDSTRLEAEKGVMKKYGLRRKKELRRLQQTVRSYRRQAKELIATQDEKKEGVLYDRLTSLGLLKERTKDEVLALKDEDLLNRRLQTVVQRLGLAKTAKQARQYVVHGKIRIDGKKVTFPSYLVKAEEESKIEFK